MTFHQKAHGLVFGPGTFGAVSVQVFAHSVILVQPVALTYGMRLSTPSGLMMDKRFRFGTPTWEQRHVMRIMSICNLWNVSGNA